MIDTDKYEGHNDAPWRTAEGQPYDDEGSHLDIVDANGVLVTETSYFTDNDHPNARLIADAPLLLEEVKRLRERVKTEKNLKLWEKAEVKRLRSIADDLYAYIVSDADISLKIIEEQMDWRDEE
jgi:hypothetical protein